MTSRQRVLRCLEMDCPDRVPRDLWTLPIAEIEYSPQAVAELRQRWPVDIRKPPGWQVRSPALLEGDLERLRPPVEFLEINQQAVADFHRHSDLFVLSPIVARPFERMQFLRGSENLYLDLAEDSDLFRGLLGIVHDFNLRHAQAWAQADVDGLMLMDDWGAQRSLLIHPQHWRRVFKPLYAQYARIGREAGKKIFMHSDGHIFDIYEDLIEIGIDAINSQLFCMDLAEIGRRFRGRITFWGEIDRQHVLPASDTKVAADAVAQVVEHLWRPEGGVIAQFELGAKARLQNADTIYETWRRLTS